MRGSLKLPQMVVLGTVLVGLALGAMAGSDPSARDSPSRDHEKLLKALDAIQSTVDPDGYLRKFVQPAQLKLLQRTQEFSVHTVHGVVGRTQCKLDHLKKSAGAAAAKVLKSLNKCRLDKGHGFLSCSVTIKEDSATGQLSSEGVECSISQLKSDFDLDRSRQHRKVKRDTKANGLVQLYDASGFQEGLLGRDDGHDSRSHKKELLGQDDHDLKPHHGEGSQQQQQHKGLLGRDDGHDQWHRDPSSVLTAEAEPKAPTTARANNAKGKYLRKLAEAFQLPVEMLPNLKDSGESWKALKKMKSKKSFKKFVKAFKRYYPTLEEYEKRYRVFAKNMVKVQFLRETEQATGQYGWTPFADLTEDEFKAHRLGLKFPGRQDGKLGSFVSSLPPAAIPSVPLPKEYDWRNYGAVTPVKNQGICGSCWAFSVTGNVEGLWKVQKGQLLSLSEQELVDCDKTDKGCQGGLPENAYKAIAEIGGLELESDYKYDGKEETCHFDQSKVKVTLSGGVSISTNETEMAQWLVANGPISIGLNANVMQFYRGGVSHPWKFLCSPSGIDHGVIITGIGVYEFNNKSYPFWDIKNSWGPGWGEKGYYRLYRGDGSCGVNLMATSAVLSP